MPYLDQYAGPWNYKEARHLLTRTTFGPSEAMVEQGLQDGMHLTVDALLEPLGIPDPPVKSIPDGSGRNQLNDPGAKYGETWVNADAFPNVNPPMLRNRVLRSRSKSLYSWTMLQAYNSGISLREKMTLFWHNHFVVAESIIPHREYLYYELLRSSALGNFKQLTKDITVDTSMLIYLSGTENTAQAPNENFSRELLELFTIGKGPLAGPGDYTNYTEEDVISMAKVLSGWFVPRAASPDTLTPMFDLGRHSRGPKLLSARFDNQIVADNGEEEYVDLIEIIFQKKECARFICRKLYTWFVSPRWDEEIEDNVIGPLADILYNNDYEVTSVLVVLFKSDIFYSSTRCMIKSPIDLIFGLTRALGVTPPTGDVEQEYDHAYLNYIMAAELEQELFFHPDVAGWKAYYQNPQLDRLWINNLLLPKRHEFARLWIEGGVFSFRDVNYRVTRTAPVLDLISLIPNATDPNILIEALSQSLFNYPLTQDQLESLKDVLIPGLPDFEWTVEYTDYLGDPGNSDLKESVENKLKSLLSVMVRMSEFQIM